MGRYRFAMPDDPTDIEALLDHGESAAAFASRITAANHVSRKEG